MERLNILLTGSCQGHEPVTQDIVDEPHGRRGAVRHVPGGLDLHQPGGVVQVDGHGAGHTRCLKSHGNLSTLGGATSIVPINEFMDVEVKTVVTEKEPLGDVFKKWPHHFFIKSRVAVNIYIFP